MTATCHCGARWTGKKVEHCTARGCHQSFSCTSAGDRHRTGPHDNRRCLTAEEMQEKGLEGRANAQGHIVWGWAAENTPWLPQGLSVDGLTGPGRTQVPEVGVAARKSAVACTDATTYLSTPLAEGEAP